MRSLTHRQLSAIKRIKRGQTTMLSPDVAKQLERRGMVTITGKYCPTEWNRPVKGGTLSVVILTPAGRLATE